MRNRYQNPIARFYSLDVLRAVAALSVVFYHWRQFFPVALSEEPGATALSTPPLFKWIPLLYDKGWLAVDLFFSLSGFVFYWLYSRRVADGSVSPGKFALLRFSRLYPLHIATLILVAGSQLWLAHAGEGDYIYSNNDGKHFLLNLFFASSWGLESGFSFNGPIWSVSVEVLLYALFFACCRLLPVRGFVLAAISLLGFFVVHQFCGAVGRGIGSFFLGGCVFLTYQAIVTSRHANALAAGAISLTAGMWAVALGISHYWTSLASLSLRSVPFLWRFEAVLQWGMSIPDIIGPVFVLFPLTILSLALLETRQGTLGRRISFIGDMSYSCYVIHFPLALLFSIAFSRLMLKNSVHNSPWFMGLYFTVL